jgi:hypothetical protein
MLILSFFIDRSRHSHEEQLVRIKKFLSRGGWVYETDLKDFMKVA